MIPKISIIVPSYNEEKNISRCLNSILNQTFKDFEVICVDDGSTDSTFEILTAYSEKDSRIIPLKNTGKGVSSARNFGIENSHGEYIGFVDSDDFIQPQMFSFLYKTISDNNADFVFCGSETTTKISEKSFDYNFKKINLSDFLFSDYNLPPICVWTKLIKKTFLLSNNIKFNNFKIGEDVLFCSELFSATENYYYVDLPLYTNYINSSGVINNNIWDKKRLDQSETFLLSYDILKKSNDIKSASWFIEGGIKYLLTYKFFSDNGDNEKIKLLFKTYYKEYKNCSEISFANKIYVFISYHFPLLYELRRKLLDKTIR